MSKASAFIDSESFGHATQLFEQKRRSLAPAVAEEFARRVVTRRASTAETCPHIR